MRDDETLVNESVWYTERRAPTPKGDVRVTYILCEDTSDRMTKPEERLENTWINNKYRKQNTDIGYTYL